MQNPAIFTRFGRDGLSKKRDSLSTVSWCARRDGVAASYASLVSALRRKLALSATAPFPITNASLVCDGTPDVKRVLHTPIRKKKDILTDVFLFGARGGT